MKKAKINKSEIYKLEKNLITLEKIKCPLEIKKKLRKAARDWIAYIKQHILDVHRDDFFEEYHLGEISFIELFFNIRKK